MILFEGETVKELETNFKEAVNHYRVKGEPI